MTTATRPARCSRRCSAGRKADAYGVDVKPRLEVIKTAEPSGRKAGVKVASVADLVEKLKNEAGVL